ncbi:MAG: AI-2E family transporter [Oscillospiraceae bacterium]|nr:AI-2E family transporter [Oscillospiraceae bacterium]
MKRVFKWDKKYLYWGITGFSVVACAILFYMALNYIGLLTDGIGTIIKILSPFVWGLVISWIIFPMMRSFEENLFMPLGERIHKKNPQTAKKFARSFAVLLSELVFLAAIAALVYLILPQLYQSIETIVRSSDGYISSLTTWIETVLIDYPEIESYLLSAVGTLNTGLIEWLRTTILPELGNLVTNVTAGVYYVLMGVYNLLIGIIVSIYVLGNLETFRANAKRMLYSAVSVDNAKRFLDGLKFTNRTFIGFLNGKLLDSAIIGLICYVCCSLLKMPYSLLVSVIVGVTNIIPFFGPFIGAIPSTIIILMVSPLKALIFVVFVLILQQVDGNIIGPKILGSTTGINGFWVMFSIILGAGLFGFWGMLLGVPVFVVIYTIINMSIEKNLKEKDLPFETSDYIGMDYIDPVSREIVKVKVEDPLEDVEFVAPTDTAPAKSE